MPRDRAAFFARGISGALMAGLMAGSLAAGGAAAQAPLSDATAPLPRPAAAATGQETETARPNAAPNAPLPRPQVGATNDPAAAGPSDGRDSVAPIAGGPVPPATTLPATTLPAGPEPLGTAEAEASTSTVSPVVPGRVQPTPPLRVAPGAPLTSIASALRQAVLTVDQEAMYRQSRWGQRAAADLAAQSRQVAADNDTAFAALVADEDALTAARPGLPPDEFRRRAAAFDERVTLVRQERDAAREALQLAADRERALFFQSAAPVMGGVMAARGALVVLDQRTVLISDQSIDATAAIIAALDAELGDGREIVAAEATADATKPAAAAPAAATDGTGSDPARGSVTSGATQDAPPAPDAALSGSQDTSSAETAAPPSASALPPADEPARPGPQP